MSNVRYGLTNLYTAMAVVLFVLAAVFVAGVHPTFAAAGDYELTVNTELAAGLAGATVTAVCDGGTPTTMVDAGGGIYTRAFAPMQFEAGCSNGETITFNISKTGFITKVDTSDTYTAASDPDSSTVSGVKYSVKVTPTREGDAGALTGATVSAGSGPTSCTESTGVYYCAVPVGEDNGITIMKSGYVTNTSGSTGTVSTSAQNAVTVSGIKFQVKITVADELGNTTTANTVTFDGNSPTISVSNVYYFARTGNNKAVSILKDGFIANETTNVSLTVVSANSSGQTRIVLGCLVDCSPAFPIAAGQQADLTGLQYKIVSNVLKSEIGGAITGIADSSGLEADANPGTDVAIAGTGSTINATAVSGNVIYIAGSWDGGGDDTLTVTLTNVTSEGGGDTVKFVVGTVVDASNVLNGATTQKIFNIGDTSTGSPDVYSEDGFKYPLKVVLGDELGGSGNTITAAGLSTKTYNSTSAYYSSGSTLYFANTGTKKTLALEKAGFVPAGTTNDSLVESGSTGVTTTQTAQVVLTFDESAASSASEITATGSLKGLEYLLQVDTLKSEIGGTISGIASGAALSGSPSGDVAIAASNGASVVASAVASDVIYIATTGDGATDGTDTVTLTLSSVTSADGALNTDIVKFVRKDIASNLLAGSVRKTVHIGVAGGDINVADGFQYPLKVTTKDELGNLVPIANMTTLTYNSVPLYYDDGGSVAYFPNSGSAGALVATVDGFVPNGTTNSGFSSFTTNQTTQTVITLGTGSPSSSILTDGTTNNVRGLTYVLKSTVLKSELGGDVSDIAAGFDGDGTPSADVTLVASNGATIVASVVDTDTIYIAATGNGATGGSDTITVQLQNVTVDSGQVNDAALVLATLTDSSNYIAAGSAQKTFGIGQATGDIQQAQGFQYPLKVVVTDERGITLDAIDEYKLNVTDGYAQDSNTKYFANVESNVTLSIKLAGYRNAQSTNTAFTDVSTNQASQTVITMSSGAANTDPSIAAGASATAKGLQFGQKVTITTEDLGVAIVPDSVTAGSSNTTCVGVAGSSITTNVAYCAVPVAEDGTPNDITIIKDGYVTHTAGDTADRTDGTDAQGTITVNDVKYALKVTVVREGDSAAVTGSTVTAGISHGVTCTESGSSGVHYCVIPLTGAGVDAQIVSSGFNTKHLTYTDRTAGTDAQGAITATLVSLGDSEAPTVSSQTPADNATGVAVTASATITFSEAMNPSTLNGGTIQIRKYSDDTAVTATILYNPSTYVVTVDPDSSLSYSTQYYLFINGAQDAAGNTESTDYSASAKASHEFTTAADSSDSTAPTVSSQSPADNATGVSATVNPYVVFTEALNPSTVSSTTVKLCSVSDAGCASPLTANISLSDGATRINIVPASALTDNTGYFIKITTGVQDLAGNALASTYGSSSASNFTTASTSLTVTQISSVANPGGVVGAATADGTFANGFAWIFNITVPASETSLKLKFSDFVSGSNSITADNMRICSAQSSNKTCASSSEGSTDWVSLTAADTYPATALSLSSDLDASTAGRQVQVKVQMKVPVSTAAGSYSGSYGVQSL